MMLESRFRSSMKDQMICKSTIVHRTYVVQFLDNLLLL